MNSTRFRLAKPLVLVLLWISIFLLSLTRTAWALPGQPPGQTVRRATATPTLIPTLVPIATPTTPISPGGIRQPIEPGQEVTLVTPGGECVAVVTADDLQERGTIELDPVPVDTLPSPSPDYTYVRACEVKFYDANGTLVASKRFTNPIEICFPYTDADLARTGNNPALLVVVYYDPQTNTWIELPARVDPENRRVCGSSIQTGLFALVIRNLPPGELPNTSGNLPDPVLLPPSAGQDRAPSAQTSVPTAVPTPTATPAVVARSGDTQPGEQVEATKPAAPPPASGTFQMVLVWAAILIILAVLAILAVVIRYRRRQKGT